MVLKTSFGGAAVLPDRGHSEGQSCWSPARGPSRHSPVPAAYWPPEDGGSPSGQINTELDNTLIHIDALTAQVSF